MTIKAFNFLNPIDDDSRGKNWRQFIDNSKFGLWTPTVDDIGNLGSAKAYYQLYGPVVFYWIKLTYNGVNMTNLGTPVITNLPYGAESTSGQRLVSESQPGFTARAGSGTNALEQLSSTQEPYIISLAGTSYIQLPTTWTAASTQIIWVQGWFFRDA